MDVRVDALRALLVILILGAAACTPAPQAPESTGPQPAEAPTQQPAQPATPEQAKLALRDRQLHWRSTKSFLKVILQEDVEAVELFLTAGIDPNAQGEWGEVAITHAAMKPNAPITRLLLAHGADPTLPGAQGRTAMWFAAGKNATTIAQLLHEAGADVNLAAEDGSTPLIEATKWGQVEMVQFLLAHGARADSHDGRAYTAMTWARTKAQTPKPENPDDPAVLIAKLAWEKKAEYTEIVGLLEAAGGGPTPRPRAQAQTAAAPMVVVAPGDISADEARAQLERMSIAVIERSLFAAAEDGPVQVVALLLAAGVDPNAQDEKGQTPLLLAANVGPEAAAHVLLAYGADATFTTTHGGSPVLLAAFAGRDELVAKLLELGADPNVMMRGTDDPFTTPLLGTCYRGNSPDTARVLLDGGADPNQANAQGETPVFVAAAMGRERILKELLASGGDPNRPGRDGRTPLIAVTANGYEDEFDMLLAAGADVATQDRFGTTPLANAAARGNTRMFQTLVGASLGPRHACTEALLAAMRGDAAVGRGGDRQCTSPGRLTPLYVAAQFGHTALVRRLLAQGADVNTAVRDGTTVLLGAAEKDLGEMAAVLLEAGADPNRPDVYGHTPVWAVAARGGSLELIERLLAAGADADLPNAQGRTALMEAARRGRADVVRVLLREGAKVNREDHEGRTAEREARSRGHMNIVRMLRDAQWGG